MANWKKTLGTIAPTIATALGGPMAGAAVAMAAKALGVSPTEEDIEAEISRGDPESFLKLKKADADFKVAMRNLDIKEEELNTSDRKSARKLAEKLGHLPQVIISAIFIAVFGFVVHNVFNGEQVPENMQNIVVFLLGILSAGITQIMNFWFGSSSGSKEKTRALSAKQ